MIKQITWAQTEVPKAELAIFLTKTNFQPGKFHIVQHQFLTDTAIVVYVDEEIG